MTRHPSALLCDFDGTLVDASGAICAAFNAVLRNHGRPELPEERIRASIGRPLVDMFADAGLACETGSLASEYRQHFMPMASTHSFALPGAAELLEAMQQRNVPVCIVTSRMSDGADLILRALGLRDTIEAIVGLEHVRLPKPSAEPVRTALGWLGIRAEQALMVGDTSDDVRAAQAACVEVIGVTSGAHPRDVLEAWGADWVVDSLHEVVARLGSL